MYVYGKQMEQIYTLYEIPWCQDGVSCHIIIYCTSSKEQERNKQSSTRKKDSAPAILVHGRHEYIGKKFPNRQNVGIALKTKW